MCVCVCVCVLACLDFVRVSVEGEREPTEYKQRKRTIRPNHDMGKSSVTVYYSSRVGVGGGGGDAVIIEGPRPGVPS